MSFFYKIELVFYKGFYPLITNNRDPWQLIQIFLAHGRANEGVPRGPRGPKKVINTLKISNTDMNTRAEWKKIKHHPDTPDIAIYTQLEGTGI